MEGESSLIERHLLEFLDTSTTPEKALESLSSCFSPGNSPDTVLIFLAYMRFIITKQPDAYVDGIWEKLFMKTIMFSRNCSDSGEEISHIMKTHTKIVLADGPRMITWLQKALIVPEKCPNPYVRLELFRMVRIFRWNKSGNMSTIDWALLDDTYESICGTFIHTISEIQPHHLYPSDGEVELLFDFTDLRFIFYRYESNLDPTLQKLITGGINEQLNMNNKVDVDSEEARFIYHCIQLIGIFAVIANSIPHPMLHIKMIGNLCLFLRHNIGRLIHSVDINLHDKTSWGQFQHVLSCLPLNSYIIATIRDLRSAILNHKCTYASYLPSASLATIIDNLARDLNVCTKSCDLPRLLMSRQVQGPTSVRQHALLANHLEPLYIIISKTDNEDDYDYDIPDENDDDAEVNDA
ncbi:unnamed protein product [Meganyctiphanes norvegica]|uniref:Uncharacterized protein n=1 Tax=Meganyctiphanes norvegica TaxID=48144 RepID=A0AAV2R944_MEGNR